MAVILNVVYHMHVEHPIVSPAPTAAATTTASATAFLPGTFWVAHARFSRSYNSRQHLLVRCPVTEFLLGGGTAADLHVCVRVRVVR